MALSAQMAAASGSSAAEPAPAAQPPLEPPPPATPSGVIDLEAAGSDLTRATSHSATARLVSGLADAARQIIGCNAISRAGTENTLAATAICTSAAATPAVPVEPGTVVADLQPEAPPPCRVGAATEV